MTPKPFPAAQVPELWEKIRARVFDTDRYLDAVVEQLDGKWCVLDLCAGQGTVPFGLDTRLVGTKFYCIDNSREMFAYVRATRNPFEVRGERVMGINLDNLSYRYILHDARFPNVPLLSQTLNLQGCFPIVTCFGNSLPYLHSWGPDRPVDETQAYRDLEEFLRTAKMYLFRDPRHSHFLLEYKKESEQPHEENLGQIEVDHRSFNVRWRISYKGRIRTWTVDLEGDESYRMQMDGFNYTRTEIEDVARKAGLKRIEVIDDYPGSPYSMYVIGMEK